MTNPLSPVHERIERRHPMSHRVTVRGRRYWFQLGIRHGFVEFGHRRLVWHIFTVPHDPPPA